MTFYNENWFWTGVFTLTASLGTILITQIINARTQTRLERLRAHESHILKAYEALYAFISRAETMLSPPSDVRSEFITIMRDYFETVKPSVLLYPKVMRMILQSFEAQYHCLGDPDLIPEEPFEQFMDKRVYKLLERLTRLVEERAETILHKT